MILHVSMDSDILDANTDDPPLQFCCIGAAVYGPGRCTCWEPEHDREQTPAAADLAPPRPRAGMCGDCACRPDSPEAREARGDEDAPAMRSSVAGVERSAAAGAPFYCHAGMRKPVRIVHPSGKTIDLGDRAEHKFDPPYARGVPIKADGTAADICAGWAAKARAAGHTWFDRGEWPPEAS